MKGIKSLHAGAGIYKRLNGTIPPLNMKHLLWLAQWRSSIRTCMDRTCISMEWPMFRQTRCCQLQNSVDWGETDILGTQKLTKALLHTTTASLRSEFKGAILWWHCNQSNIWTFWSSRLHKLHIYIQHHQPGQEQHNLTPILREPAGPS